MTQTAPGVTILGKISNAEEAAVLSVQAQEFVAKLNRAFNGRRKELLKRREERQAKLDRGELLDFLPETKAIRENDAWTGPVPGPGLVDRRVEITGPVDRKMVINALNSNAYVFMADFEGMYATLLNVTNSKDSNAPTWENNISGQVNLRDALLRTISFTGPNGKQYALRKDKKPATLMVRPRGWHMEEDHFLVDGEPCSGSIFDFGVYFFNNAFNSIKAGQGPYFYLPKMESHLEARLWNDIFNCAQDMIGMTRGTIRATVLIETIPAAFEMDEIIYELRDHSAGLNCGRWDYIFSVIKKFRNNPNFILPERGDVTMTTPFMDAYVRLLIKTCHRRQVHAMGGMAAQIPIKDDPAANEAAMNKVKADKLREVKAGHDGTWVAHPDLVKIALDVFNQHMPTPNQFFVRREEVNVTAKDLLNTKDVKGKITEQGIRLNINIALQYMEAWLRGNGCVPIHGLMEDAATAEISRSQLWQWQKNAVKTTDGKTITPEWLSQLLDDETNKIKQTMGDKFGASKFVRAKELLRGTIVTPAYADFLTTLCYPEITSTGRVASKL